MTNPQHEDPLVPEPPPVRGLAFKAALLMALTLLLVVGSVLYVMFARGVFEPTQRVVLIADDAEGVTVGMDMTFAGFAIGRVARVELGEDGNARILVDVAEKDAKWLRSSSIFTMERSLVGGTRIRAFSGVLDDPPLPDGAERTVLRGDAAAEIPQITAAVRELLENLKAMTQRDAALNQTLANLQTTTEKLNGPHGALGVLTGNEADAKQLAATIASANALMARANALTARLDSLVANADRQVFGQGAAPGEGSLLGDVRATVTQLNGLLGDARGSLQKVDAVLVEAQGIASNTREATTDLTALRAEVERSLRQVDSLINEINRKWPFARDTEIKLP
ncbi:MAG: MlaD family protein [Hydrogenophaga sp.]|jgi:phospholipid/cholesterol/gamma-HCH transport system substrate-binding protein|uniref:MlaD family protein n=1 Tax=Hydrogenophaga intermedia TaxID=65786 RepID=UPI002043676F|nr:MlaD family protein [Hydrogenophaga intermedia]MCM3565618.1 MlaD family protein [Hydrogenophaga intermedia]